MGERKVIQQYYPPDFDPANLPRAKRADLNALKVRMMLPMSIRCATCGTFMSKGTKFNTKKEDVAGETYLGIQVLRFYMRCSACSAEITFKTDPENSSYTVEHGATANWVPWQPGGGGDGGGASSSAAPPPPEAESGDAMAALEARVAASKRELDMLDAVDELRARAAARAALAPDAALAALAAADDAGAGADPDAEDEAEVARMLAARASRVARLADDDEAAAPPPPPPPPASTTALAPPPPAARRGVKPAVVVVKKRPAAAAAVDGGGGAAKKAAPAPASDDGGGGGLAGLVGGYGSSSSE